MKIAYFSPLNPLRSGISDYSEELLPELSKDITVDLFLADFIPTSAYISKNHSIKSISSFNEELYHQYDEVVYHIGNNTTFHKEIYLKALEYPGVVVLHDYSIHHLIANLTVALNDWDGYIEEMRYNYGADGENFAILASEGKMKVMWESNQTIKYPANKRIIDRSKGLIVHSDLAYQGIKNINSGAFIKYAPLFTTDIYEVSYEEKRQLRKKYNVPEESLIFSSFGFVSKAKRITSVLQAISKLSDREKSKITYLIVGEEEPNVKEVEKVINELQLNDFCRFIGFVSLEGFKDYIKLSDVCINLRYPTQGETSASLIRILGYGKPALVSDIGTFSEFPDDFTIKISTENTQRETDDIVSALRQFIEAPNLSIELGEKALSYIRDHHTVKHTANAYFEAINGIRSLNVFSGEPRFYYDYLDEFTERNKSILSYSEDLQEKCANMFSIFFENHKS